MNGVYSISPEERSWAILAHLSGLGYVVIPLGGILFPIIIMKLKSHSPVISTIAKQALILNLTSILCLAIGFILMLTVILIPVSVILFCIGSLITFIFPIIGAIKAADGHYYRYPVVGRYPGMGTYPM